MPEKIDLGKGDSLGSVYPPWKEATMNDESMMMKEVSIEALQNVIKSLSEQPGMWRQVASQKQQMGFNQSTISDIEADARKMNLLPEELLVRAAMDNRTTVRYFCWALRNAKLNHIADILTNAPQPPFSLMGTATNAHPRISLDELAATAQRTRTADQWKMAHFDEFLYNFPRKPFHEASLHRQLWIDYEKHFMSEQHRTDYLANETGFTIPDELMFCTYDDEKGEGGAQFIEKIGPMTTVGGIIVTLQKTPTGGDLSNRTESLISGKSGDNESELRKHACSIMSLLTKKISFQPPALDIGNMAKLLVYQAKCGTEDNVKQFVRSGMLDMIEFTDIQKKSLLLTFGEPK